MKNHPFMTPEMMEERRRGRMIGGLLMIALGGLWLAKTLGYALPPWTFSWPVIFIAIGIYQLVKHAGRKLHGLIFLAIGGIGLADKLITDVHIGKVAWPVLIILAGLYLLFKPGKRKQTEEPWAADNTEGLASDDSTADYIKVNSVFGGIEKTVISKQFRGGQINSVFGGSEINLMQADFQGRVVLEINTVFGGCEMAVPSDWKIQNEITAIMGGIEDRRPMNPAQADSGKVLLMKGTCVFGGVEIKGF